MAKKLIAKGQATIVSQKDAYTINQSIGEFVFSADNNGIVANATSFVSTVTVTMGDSIVTNFTIGAITKPIGFSTITADNISKTITYSVAVNTSTLSDNGVVTIPIIISGITYNLSFKWSKAKAGASGGDAAILDWVADWNSGKTVIDSQSVITPKIFAGIKNANGTLTGMAIGKFILNTQNTSGTIAKETINGIYAFDNGKKTFEINAIGNVQLGNGNEYIKFNAITGKIEFGSAVSLSWIGATYIDNNGIFTGTLSANTVNAIKINATQITVGTINADRIDVNALKASLITAGNIEALTLSVTKGKIGGWSLDADSIFRGIKKNTLGELTAVSGAITIGSNGIRGLKWRFESNGSGSIAGNNILWDAAGNLTFSSAVALLWNNAAVQAANSGRLYVRGTGQNHSATCKIILSGMTISETSSRGLTLTVIVRDSLVVNSTMNYDVYGNEANCNALATVLNAQGSDKIVILTSYDAIRINATLNAAIQRCGGSDRLIADERIPFAFIGIPGIGKNNGLFSMYGLGASEPYAELSTIVINGVPQGISINGQRDTFINGNGIYTGVLNANQITAGMIDAARLNVNALKAALITAGNIEALTLAVTKGTIGGWTIAADSISSSHLILDNVNRRIAVYGASSSSRVGQRVQLYYNDDSDYGLFATDTSGSCVVSLGSANRIAGWMITTTKIHKNNVSLGADGSIVNGVKWKFNNDGSGQIAAGNILWNADGVIVFSPSVSLNWTNAATNALNSAKLYADMKKTEAINSAANDATIKAEAAKELASAMAFGKMLNRDPTFSKGDNGTNTYNNSQNGTVTIVREQDNNAPNDSKYVLRIRNTGTASPYCGGFYFATDASYRKIFITRIIAKIPSGREISYHSNSIGTGGTQKWLTPTFGTGDWCEYICKVRCGTSSFSSTHFFALTGPFGSESTPVDWFLSYATVFDVTSTEKYSTTIDGNGIYTASLNANQLTAGTINADRIAVGSIHSTKLDAVSLKANLINTSYINGLNCSFVQGTIGGWAINTYDITAGIIGGTGTMPMQIRSRAFGAGYWYTGEYRPSGISMTWHQSANAGHLVFGQIASTGNSIKTGFMGIQMMAWDNTEYFCLSANYSRSGSKETYNRIAGWAFDYMRIWKNNVSLGADGSITNGAKWQINNDGSGMLASNNIVWDASGHITFSPSVSLLWTNAANKGKLFARGTGLNHNANRLVYLNGNEIVSSSMRGMMLTVIHRNDLTVTSSVNYDVYASDTVCNSLASALNSLTSDYIIVLTSNDAISINTTLNIAIQRCGGSDLIIYQKRTPYVLIGIPTIGKDNGLVAVYGESSIEPYAEISTVIFNGTPQGMNVYGKQKTYIDGNGIYTGTLHANQINTGTISADRIAAGSINASKLDAASIKANIINTGYINGLSCTFDKGTIGGWYINSYQIYKNSVALSSDGSIINGSRWRLNNDGSGQLANGNIYWDAVGNVTAKGAVFNNVRVQGSVRNPFVLNDSSIWIGGDTSNQQNFNNYDNIVAVRGSWDENIDLPWTLANSGRRVTLVNYKWGSNTTVGYMTIYAPSGKYFFEDGIQKSSITFSREMVELLGYGDNATFFGWIVINRRDVMCNSKYGSNLKCLGSGIATISGTSVSLKQKTFDGTMMSISRTGVGRYTVYLPWGLSSNYFVQMTGYYTSTPIYATIIGIYSSYFYVQTQDDSSANEGSFCFQVFSTADWS